MYVGVGLRQEGHIGHYQVEWMRLEPFSFGRGSEDMAQRHILGRKGDESGISPSLALFGPLCPSIRLLTPASGLFLVQNLYTSKSASRCRPSGRQHCRFDGD